MVAVLAGMLAQPVLAQTTPSGLPDAEHAARRLQETAGTAAAGACAAQNGERGENEHRGWFGKLTRIFSDDDEHEAGGCVLSVQGTAQNSAQPPANGLFAPGAAPRAQLN